MTKQVVRKPISDLGVAAYLKMHAYKCIGKKGRSFYFEVAEEEMAKFDTLCMEYINSPYHDFDSCIMSLKKVPEFLPN